MPIKKQKVHKQAVKMILYFLRYCGNSSDNPVMTVSTIANCRNE